MNSEEGSFGIKNLEQEIEECENLSYDYEEQDQDQEQQIYFNNEDIFDYQNRQNEV